MFVNGELTDEVIMLASIQKNSSPISIGNMYNDSKRHFNGALDDYKIYNKALTEKEIKEEYLGQPVCVETIYETGYDTVKVAVEDTLTITLDEVLAVTGGLIQSDIKVYPNPTSDKISFDFGNFVEFYGFSVKIMNNQGQEVFTEDIDAQNISTSLLGLGGKGLYIIHVLDHNDEIVDVKKLVVK